MKEISHLIPIIDELYARTHIPIVILNQDFVPIYPKLNTSLFLKLIDISCFQTLKTQKIIIEDQLIAYAGCKFSHQEQVYYALCGCLLHNFDDDQDLVPSKIRSLISFRTLQRHITKEHPSTFTSFVKTLALIMDHQAIIQEPIETIYVYSKPQHEQEEDLLTLRRLIQSTPDYYVWEQKFFDSFKHGNFNKMRSLLSDIHQFDLEVPVMESFTQIKFKLVSFITLLTRVSISQGASVDVCFTLSDLYLQRIEHMQDRSLATTLLEEAIIEFFPLFADIHQNYSLHVYQCIHFIDTHLYDKLSLKTLASVTGLSCAYLSDLFKQETKETITHYIQRRKIEEAERLLLFTSKQYSEISSILNFHSQSAFIQIFKRIKGVTPKQYRMMEVRSA